jgi:hypothetical protein
MAALNFTPSTYDIDGADRHVVETTVNGMHAGDHRFFVDSLYASMNARLATPDTSLWAAFRRHVSKTMSQAVTAARRDILRRITAQDCVVLSAQDIDRFGRGGHLVNQGAPSVPALRIRSKVRLFLVLAACELVAGLTNRSLGGRVAVLCRRAARLAHAFNAQGQENIRRRIAARIADPNSSDEAAFDAAKDGEKAIRALNGAAAAERRAFFGKRKRGGDVLSDISLS